MNIRQVAPIEENGKGDTGLIDGRLDKIALKLNKPSKTVRLKVTTCEGELVHDAPFGQDDKTTEVYYPYIIIETLQDGISRTKDFYLYNNLHYEITGLSDGIIVEHLNFYFEPHQTSL